MGKLVGERRRETEKERERDRKREGGVKQMYQNCIPTLNINSLWIKKNSIHSSLNTKYQQHF